MKNIFSKKFIQFSTAVTFVVFLINSVAWGQVTSGFRPSEIRTVLSVSIPSELGRVIETEASFPDQPLVIHIQDAHANDTAQKNMAKILDYLVHEKKINTVFVEGAIGELDARYLKFSEDRKLNRKIVDHLTRFGLMTASDLYLFDHPRGVDFIGIENAELYREDLNLFKKVMSQEKQSREWIRSNEKELERNLTRSVNKDLLTALRIYLREDASTSSIMKVLGTLGQLSERHLNRDLRDAKEQKEFPNLVRLMRLKLEKENLDQAKVTAEQKEIERLAGACDLEHDNPRFELERLYAKLKSKGFEFSKYPNFTRYAKRLIYERELDSSLLFEELDRWLELLMNTLAKTPEEKRAVEQVKQAKLEAKLLVLELTRKDWPKTRDLRPETRTLVAGRGSLVNAALEFYRLAEQREAAFFDTIQKTLKARHESRAIVITGGFHSDALKKYFVQTRANYTVIMPGVEGDSRTSYVKALLGRASETAASSDLAINPLAEPPAFAAKLGINLGERKAVIAEARAASLGEDENGAAAASKDSLTIGKEGFELAPGQETIVHAGDHYFYVSYNQVILLDEKDFSPVKTIPLSGKINIEADKFWATDSENLDLVRKFLEWRALKQSVLLSMPFGNRAGGNGGMYFINVKDPRTDAVQRVIGTAKPGDVRRAVVKFSKEDVNRSARYQTIKKEWGRIRDFMAETLKAGKLVFRDLGVEDDEKETYVQQPLVVLSDLIRDAKTLEEKKYFTDRFVSFIEAFWGAGFMDMDLRPENCGFNKDGRLVIHDFDYTKTMKEFAESDSFEKRGVFVNYIVNNAIFFEQIDENLRNYFLSKVEAISFMKEIINESEQESQFHGTFKNYVLVNPEINPEAYDKAIEEARKNPLLALIRWGVQKNKERELLQKEQKRFSGNLKMCKDLEEKIQAICNEIALNCFNFFEEAVNKREANLIELFEGIKKSETKKEAMPDAVPPDPQMASLWAKKYVEPYKNYQTNAQRFAVLERELGDWIKSPVLDALKQSEEESLKEFLELRKRLNLVDGRQIFVGRKVPRFQMLDQDLSMKHDYHFVVIKMVDPDDGTEKLYIMDLNARQKNPSQTNIFRVVPSGTYKFKKQNTTTGDIEEVSLAQWGVGTINVPQPETSTDQESEVSRVPSIRTQDLVRSMRASDPTGTVKKPEIKSDGNRSSTSMENPFKNLLLKAVLDFIQDNRKNFNFSEDTEKMNQFRQAVAEGFEILSPESKKELESWEKEIESEGLRNLDLQMENGVIRVAHKKRRIDPIQHKFLNPLAKIFPGYEFREGKWSRYYVQVTGNVAIGQGKRAIVRPEKNKDGKTVWTEVKSGAKSLGSEKSESAKGHSLGAEKDEFVSPNGMLLPADSEVILSAANSTFYLNSDRVALIVPDAEGKNLLQMNAVPFVEGTFLEREKSGGKQFTWSTSQAELEKIYKFFKWKTLGTDVVLKKPRWAGRGANGIALHILVKSPETAAFHAVLGETKPDQVSKVYLKISAKATTRDEVFDEISKPQHERLRKFMAATARLVTEQEFKEAGLKKPEQYETQNKLYVQQPVVILSDVMRNARSLDTQKFLIDQFVDRVEAFWRSGFIDMDSRPDNWGFNEEGDLVFHDFDYTITSRQFNNPETYKKFNMSELDFKAQLFANYVLNNAAFFYRIDPLLADYFLTRIATVPFINEILVDCETSDDPARFKRLMGLAKAWNGIKTEKEKTQVIYDVVEYFKTAVMSRKDDLAALFRNTPPRTIKDSEKTSIAEQKKRLASQWAKIFVERYHDYNQQAKRYEEMGIELSEIVDSKIFEDYNTEEFRNVGILLNKTKELNSKFQLKGIKLVCVGKSVPHFQLRVNDPMLDDFHFVVIKGQDPSGKYQTVVLDYGAVNEGDGKSKTQIMAVNSRGSVPIYLKTKTVDPEKGFVTKLEPVRDGQLVDPGTMEQNFGAKNNNEEDLLRNLGIELVSEEGESISDIRQADKPAESELEINTFDIQSALAGWEEEKSVTPETKRVDVTKSGEFKLPAAASEEDPLREVKKNIVAANAQLEDLSPLIRKARKKGYQLVIWKDVAKMPQHERKAWLRNLDFNITKLDQLYQDWVMNHAPLTVYVDDAGIWVQGGKPSSGDTMAYEAFEFDGKKWQHTYFKFVVQPELGTVQRIVVEPALEGGSIVLRKKITPEKPEKDNSVTKWLDFTGVQGSPLAKKFARSNVTLGWFKALVREAFQSKYCLDVAIDLKGIGDKQKAILETAVSKLSQVSEVLKRGKTDPFLSIHIHETPFGIQIPYEQVVIGDVYLKRFEFDPAAGAWQPYHALKWASKESVTWKP
ncbi:MAG: hypothetical protein HZC17_05085, partial [Candidatus Omnitrophica bacterium]|nr:hypothetical protein [Candidatus Omnitrophota bacterium]